MSIKLNKIMCAIYNKEKLTENNIFKTENKLTQY